MVEAIDTKNADNQDDDYYGEYGDEGEYVPPEYDPQMRKTFPNRNTYEFENGVKITSDFESGNLWKCVEIKPSEVEDDTEWYYDEEEEVKDDAGDINDNTDPKEPQQYDINDV